MEECNAVSCLVVTLWCCIFWQFVKRHVALGGDVSSFRNYLIALGMVGNSMFVSLIILFLSKLLKYIRLSIVTMIGRRGGVLPLIPRHFKLYLPCSGMEFSGTMFGQGKVLGVPVLVSSGSGTVYVSFSFCA